MTAAVVADGEITFEPGAGWQWQSPVTVPMPAKGHASSGGKKVATEADVPDLARGLLGKAYKASGFDAAPGSVASAEVRVDAGTLSPVARVGGKKVVTAATTGTFTISVTPSANGKGDPDPQSSHTGKWKVKSAGQPVVQSAT